MPFSAFILILTGILSGLPGGDAVTPVALGLSSFYPLALTAVLVFSIATGFGRNAKGLAAKAVSAPTLSAPPFGPFRSRALKFPRRLSS